MLIFTVVWNPETGEASLSGSMEAEVAIQVIMKVVAQQAVNEAMAELAKLKEDAK